MPPRPTRIVSALGVAACVVLGFAPDARADASACLVNRDRANALERADRLRQATTAASACAEASCDADVRVACQEALARIRLAQPTVVVELKRASGEPITGGVVRIDGESPVPLGGDAFAIDPGEHRVVFGADGFAPRSTEVVVRRGEKDAKLLLVIDGGVSGPPFSPWAHVLGATGLASLTAFAIVGSVALVEHDDLVAECGDRCARERPDAVDAIVAKATVADVCLGAGIGLLVAAGLVMGFSWNPASDGTTVASAGFGPTSATFTLRY